jgi:hypothetical protein
MDPAGATRSLAASKLQECLNSWLSRSLKVYDHPSCECIDIYCSPVASAVGCAGGGVKRDTRALVEFSCSPTREAAKEAGISGH